MQNNSISSQRLLKYFEKKFSFTFHPYVSIKEDIKNRED